MNVGGTGLSSDTPGTLREVRLIRSRHPEIGPMKAALNYGESGSGCCGACSIGCRSSFPTTRSSGRQADLSAFTATTTTSPPARLSHLLTGTEKGLDAQIVHLAEWG